MKNVSELGLDEIIHLMKIYNQTGEWQMEGDLTERLSEIWDDYSPVTGSSIEDLKKQIKYSRNPLELKILNKKLNDLYKRQQNGRSIYR